MATLVAAPAEEACAPELRRVPLATLGCPDNRGEVRRLTFL